MLLLEYLLTQANQEIIAPPSPIASSVYICQLVKDALKKQIFQERLLNQVTTQRTDSEKNLLIAIAEQLAIAIHQAELMQTLTQEKQTLEQQTNNPLP